MEESDTHSGSGAGVYDCGLLEQAVSVYHVGIRSGDRTSDGPTGEYIY